MTTLYEVDEDAVPVRQVELYADAPFVHRFDRESRPFIENLKGDRFGEIRSEPLDVVSVASNQITAEEFEFSWKSGLLREPDFGEFKWEILACAAEDRHGVYEAWWQANTWYPNRPVSERMGMAERALRELLAEGLISLVTSQGGQQSEVAMEQHDPVLRQYSAWVVSPESAHVSYILTRRGMARVQEAAVFRLP